jgi:ABC-2 type transport system permease protein
MLRALFVKEIREIWRTWRFIILVAVLVISGLISPLLAYYTPVILRSVPGLPAGMTDLIPDPTVADSVAQFVKNVSQFGVLLIVILSMGCIAQEIERGTAGMLLVRPVRRSVFVLVKWLVWTGTLAIGMLLSAFLCALYTDILFEPLQFGGFLQLNLLIFIFLEVYLTVTLMCSALARTQAIAAGAAFGGMALLLILSSLPRLGNVMPGKLSSWGSALALSGKVTSVDNPAAWSALWISLGIIAVALFIACLRVEKEEI